MFLSYDLGLTKCEDDERGELAVAVYGQFLGGLTWLNLVLHQELRDRTPGE